MMGDVLGTVFPEDKEEKHDDIKPQSKDTGTTLLELKKKFEAHGQGHVFKFLDRLNENQKQELYNNLSSINLEAINQRFKNTVLDDKGKKKKKIEPFTGNVGDSSSASDEQKKLWYDKGLELISEGKVGVILMAGGQGTRLGSNDPKGMYDVGLPSGKSLFQIQAERIITLKALARNSRKEPTKSELSSNVIGSITKWKRTVRLPWYILTSLKTHDKTVAYFEKKNYFGLDKSDVFFFVQKLEPCLTNDGKLILETMTKLASAPGGNGAIYGAAKNSGALANMKVRGVEYLHCFGVDNILVKVADPYSIGFMALEKSDVCNKVTLKVDPMEKVGVMCLIDGKPGVVEYSDMTEEECKLRDANGKLMYDAGNIAMHFFTVSFFEKVSSMANLPYHVARKKIPYMNDAGQTIKPEKANGIKLEMFIFDVFCFSEKMSCFACQRKDEFSPVKNKNGPVAGPIVNSSPASARLDLSNYHIRWVTQNGGTVKARTNNQDCFEISPLVSYDGENLSKIVNNSTYPQPYHLC